MPDPLAERAAPTTIQLRIRVGKGVSGEQIDRLRAVAPTGLVCRTLRATVTVEHALETLP